MTTPRKPPKKPRPGALAEAVKAPPERPSLDAFLDHVFVEFGGPESVARAAVAEFRAAREGSLFRLRFLESLLRTLKATHRTGPDGVQGLTDADLERELLTRELAIIQSLAAQEAHRDARPESPPAGRVGGEEGAAPAPAAPAGGHPPAQPAPLPPPAAP